MKTMLPVVLGLAVVSMARGDEEPVKNNPTPRHFLGKWVGKWDNTWKVQFTITQDPKSEQLSVLYEWQEIVGQPLQKKSLSAKIEKDTLVMSPSGASVIEITLLAKATDKAKAVGKFKTPRTAALTREKE